MAASFSSVVRFVRRIGVPAPAGVDAELLDRFVTRQDAAAFTALVERHAPVVMGVCRRMLGNHHDAEDACQATFLVLARRAGSVGQPGLLSSWLYRVAYRVALRAATARRKHKQALPEDIAAAEAVPDVEWAELRAVLDAEIDRLPERYRLPLVLCHVQGKTNDEAARMLGCPKGTVGSRLATARERLRARLTRRGLAPTAGLLAAALTQESLSAAVPPALAGRIEAAATAYLAGTATRTAAATLAEGVMQAMFIARLRTATIVILVLGLLGVGVGLVSYQPWAAAQPHAEPAQKEAKGADRLTELLRKRRDAAKREYEDRKKVFEDTQGAAAPAIEARLRYLSAKLEFSRKREERIAALEEHLADMKSFESIEQTRFENGKIRAAEAAMAQSYRLDAEIRLEREKTK